MIRTAVVWAIFLTGSIPTNSLVREPLGKDISQIAAVSTADVSGRPVAEANFRRPVQEESTAAGEPRNAASQNPGSRDPSPLFDDELPEIEASKLQLSSPETPAEWAGRSAEQLIGDLRLSAKLHWKGRVHLSPLLQPLPPNLELVILAEGDFLASAAIQVGQIRFESLQDDVDNRYQPVVLPPGLANPVRDWVPVAGENARRSVAPQAGVSLGVELPRPSKLPQAMQRASGQLGIRLARARKVLTLSNAGSEIGRLQHPLLEEKQIRVALRQPDETTLLIEVSGKTTDLASVKLKNAPGQRVAGSSLNSLQAIYYQYDFIDSVPENLDLEVELVAEARELTVPFDFQDIPLQAADAASDTLTR